MRIAERPSHPITNELRSFFAKVERNDSGCWIWQGGSSGNYGVHTWRKKTTSAHRFAYRWFGGDIPDGYDIDHLCCVYRCVNPAHLEPVTRKENLARYLKSRPPRVLCRNNRHAMTDDNILHRVSAFGVPYIACRACREATEARREEKRRRKEFVLALAEASGCFDIHTSINTKRTA
jgi:hypothetical protein